MLELKLPQRRDAGEARERGGRNLATPPYLHAEEVGKGAQRLGRGVVEGVALAHAELLQCAAGACGGDGGVAGLRSPMS